ncbi:MAG: VWA domain-containing protein, partial [Clostridia bacterium]|nr:VWA domain-containing protein [Clostridia bacterium]
MSLLQGLGLLGLLGIPIIILIYLLKSKYTQKPVSSTFIWQRSLKYLKTRLPLNFTFSLLLVLQLLMVILASLALSRPTIIPFATKDTIIVLDSSASMKTVTDNGKTRYELALEKLESEANSAGENNKFTVINAGTKAESLTVRSSSKAEVLNKLNEIECTDGTPDIDGALQLVNNVQNINPEAKVYFYTDKTYMDQYGIEVVDFSTDEDINIGITSLTDSLMGGRFLFNAVVNNFSQEEQEITVVFYMDTEIDGVNNSTEHRRANYTLPADSKNVITFTNNEANVIEGNLFFQIDKLSTYESVRVEIIAENDGLDTDNSRTIYCAAENRVKILVVSKDAVMMKAEDGSSVADVNATTFLVAVLRVLGHSLSNKTDIKKELSQVNNGGAIEGYDLYIFEGVMPAVLPDDGAVWFVNPPSDPVGTSIQLSGVEPIEAPEGKPYQFIAEVENDTEAYKTLTKNIGGENGSRKIYVGKFWPIKDTSGTYESVFNCHGSGQTKTVMLAGRENNVRVVCLSLDLHKTNLTMLIDF